MRCLLAVVVLLVLRAEANPQAEDNYPIGALKCKYNLKRGTNAGVAGSEEMRYIVCPEGQDRFCVKQEIQGLDRDQCGKTEYFGDEYVEESESGGFLQGPQTIKKCLFHKCASTCEEGTELVHSELLEEYREQQTYKRRTFCCQTDYCNSAASHLPPLVLLTFLTFCLTTLFLWRR